MLASGCVTVLPGSEDPHLHSHLVNLAVLIDICVSAYEAVGESGVIGKILAIRPRSPGLTAVVGRNSARYKSRMSSLNQRR